MNAERDVASHRRLEVFLFVFLCLFSWQTENAHGQSPLNAQPAAKKSADPARFESEIVAFETWDAKNSFPADAVLFIGSSTIRFWPTAESFPDLPVINRGFGGSQTSDVNHYFDRIVPKYEPQIIIFYCGDNDLAAGKSPDEVFRDFETFRTRMHAALPSTRIIYLSVKPSPARWKLWSEMQSVNARVKAVAEKVDFITYIDTSKSLLGADGQPVQDLFRSDGLHLNAKGYAAWTSILAPTLRSVTAK